jgi:hypothetical protein
MLTVDSQMGANLRVCADEEDRTDFDQRRVDELEIAITEYRDNHNADPRPFIWTKSAGEILEKVARAKQALESQH